MDDSDQLLLNSLKFQGIQFKDVGMNQLTSEDLISIGIQYLILSGTPQFQISSLKTTKSTFRQAGKIQELLQAQGLRFDVQAIVNPNINDTRKLIVNLLSKLSQNTKQETKNQTYEEILQDQRLQKRQQSMKNFFQEWVNPTLLHHPNIEQRFLRLHLMNILTKEPIIVQLANKGVRKHLYVSIASMLDLRFSRKPTDEPLQERLQLIKKMRRHENPDEFLAQYKGQLAGEKEREEWEELQQGNKQLKKAQKLLKEDDKQEEEIRKQKEEENQSLFTLEIQFQEETKQVTAEVDDFKQQIRQNIDNLTQSLQEQERLLNKLDRQRQKIEDSNTKLLDDLQSVTSTNQELQKTIQSQHLVLQQLESKNDNDAEVLALQKEVDLLKTEWEQQRLELRQEIDEVISKASEKKQKVEQLEDKLRRLQEENQMIRNEGKIKLDKKDELILKFQTMQKDVSRSVYVRKINELKTSLDKQKAEYLKTAKEVQKLSDSLDFQNNTIARLGTELENMMNMDPKKNEQIAKSIAQQYLAYRKMYSQSLDIIKDVGDKRIQVYEAEILSDLLLAKGYKNNVDKLRQDLQDIKQENAKLK